MNIKELRLQLSSLLSSYDETLELVISTTIKLEKDTILHIEKPVTSIHFNSKKMFLTFRDSDQE